MKKQLKKYLLYLAEYVFACFIVFNILNLIFPLKIYNETSQIVLSSDSTVIHAFLTSDEKWRMYTELEDISPEFKKAIIYKEDKYFYYHFGINPFAILRALADNVLKRKRTSGASTISMQVIRLLEPRERTYLNKFIEMFRAIQLEIKMSKDEILRLYLNLVPYGGNIEGIKSASIIYFDKMPNHLSLAEITTLTIIPNRPNSLRIDQNNDYIVEQRNKWLNKFLEAGLFSEQDITDAINEPLNAYRHEIPKMAPQFCLRMKNLFSRKIIHTSLDIKKQADIEVMVKYYISRLTDKNIKNATVLVVDNETHQIVSYVGSADFFNFTDAGQVDGIQAVRSPGSTLKPFLYAIAFDEGIITPKFVIADVPVNYMGYEPENYDDKFNGNVTVEYALSHSLNVPAVKLLKEVSTDNFFDNLSDAEFNSISENRYSLGLSAILGGCGVSLEELVRLYSAFANYGLFSEFNYLQNDTSSFNFQLISEESAYLISEILTQVSRPDLPLEWQDSQLLPKVAWKTGTSYGRKDAWSIGYNKKYTIGVWVGNFSSESVVDLNGTQYAAPLLFNIFNLLQNEFDDEWLTPTENLDFRTVCSESGLPPSEYCENLIIDYYIPGVSTVKTCTHLKQVFISPDSTISYCTNCLPEAGYIKSVYNNYAPDLISFFELYNINYQKIPEHNSDCERVFDDDSPIITSPLSTVEYYVDKIDSTQIMLSADVANDVSKIFWYVNDKFLKSTLPGEKVFFTPPSGSVKISCSDDKARNSDVWIEVKYIAF